MLVLFASAGIKMDLVRSNRGAEIAAGIIFY